MIGVKMAATVRNHRGDRRMGGRRVLRTMQPARLAAFFLILLMVYALGTFGPNPAGAVDMGDALLRDYVVSLTLPYRRLELGLDYLQINETTDIFGVRDLEWNNIAKAYRIAGVSDMQGVHARINYGWSDQTTVSGDFKYRDLDYGVSKVGVYSWEASLRQNLWNRSTGWHPLLAIDGGLRINATSD